MSKFSYIFDPFAKDKNLNLDSEPKQTKKQRESEKQQKSADSKTAKK